MSMTPFQREGLQLLGYTKRESEFLFLVATHSGYFTNRQFKSFLGTESGSASHAFAQRLLARKHATYRAYRSGARVYHVFARKVYQAIERENLRTRKKHELEYVKTRLAVLDFVLAHSEHRYLETEADKVAFFSREYNLGTETLPVKQYRAKKSSDLTSRYFVDRFPMFVNSVSSQPVVTFSYVDAAGVTLDGLGTHLRAYLNLFRALPQFEFLYLAPTARLFEAAKSEFARVLYGRRGGSTTASVLEYFRLRKAWDSKERVTSAGVVLLKEAQAHYCGSGIEELYGKWRNGIVGDEEVARAGNAGREYGKGTFRAELCGSSLKVFSDPVGNDMESWAETEIFDAVPQNSGQSSAEVSRA
jgi:hypothetical protein